MEILKDILKYSAIIAGVFIVLFFGSAFVVGVIEGLTR